MEIQYVGFIIFITILILVFLNSNHTEKIRKLLKNKIAKIYLTTKNNNISKTITKLDFISDKSEITDYKNGLLIITIKICLVLFLIFIMYILPIIGLLNCIGNECNNISNVTFKSYASFYSQLVIISSFIIFIPIIYIFLSIGIIVLTLIFVDYIAKLKL